jgi:hypothetical protein
MFSSSCGKFGIVAMMPVKNAITAISISFPNSQKYLQLKVHRQCRCRRRQIGHWHC